jgi:hypothetical protein
MVRWNDDGLLLRSREGKRAEHEHKRKCNQDRSSAVSSGGIHPIHDRHGLLLITPEAGRASLARDLAAL